MTPKEKATELVKKFLPEVQGADRYNYNLDEINFFISKQCALIAVEEIKKAHPIIPLTYMLESEAIDAAIEYWNEVKSEIEKL